MRILLVEDEIRLSTLLRRAVSEEGHVVEVAGSGEAAIDLLDDRAPFDAIVLDIMLPGIDGLTLCRTLRRWQVQAPILLLTARDAVPDRVAGLDAGADDYLVKPFALSELLARLRALHRRPPVAYDPELQVGHLRLDPANHRVWRDDQEIALPNKEFRMLEYFMRNPRRVLTRAMLADQLWDYDFPNVTNVIDVHIRSLRNRIGDPYPGGMIETVRGVGYRLRSDATVT